MKKRLICARRFTTWTKGNDCARSIWHLQLIGTLSWRERVSQAYVSDQILGAWAGIGDNEYGRGYEDDEEREQRLGRARGGHRAARRDLS